MSNAQLIDIINPKTNYSMVSNHLNEICKRSCLSGLQFQVLFSVKGKTLQYKKAFARMTSTYIANDIGNVNPVSVRRALSDLFKRKILLKTKDGIGFNPDLTLWITGKLSKGVYQNGYTHCNNTDTESVTIQLHNKRNKEKIKDHSLSIKEPEQISISEKPDPLDDFKLTEEHNQFKFENKLDINLQREHLSFVLHNKAHGIKHACLESAFKKWILNARPIKRGNTTSPDTPKDKPEDKKQESQVNTQFQKENPIQAETRSEGTQETEYEKILREARANADRHVNRHAAAGMEMRITK